MQKEFQKPLLKNLLTGVGLREPQTCLIYDNMLTSGRIRAVLVKSLYLMYLEPSKTVKFVVLNPSSRQLAYHLLVEQLQEILPIDLQHMLRLKKESWGVSIFLA